MEITTTTITRNPARRAIVNALAAVGFIVLILIGIGLAIYSSRLAPKFASRISGAAVSLSSIFHHSTSNASLEVVTATSSLPIETPVLATSTAVITPVETTPVHTTTHAQPVVGYTTITTTSYPNLYGNPDLAVTITDTGYLRSGGDTDSFAASSHVPNNKEGAVQFTVTNVGTNESGSWDFKAEIPTSPTYTYDSPNQPSLRPGDSIQYTLGFSKGREGDNREITITVDPGHDVHESDEDNNEDSARVDINN